MNMKFLKTSLVLIFFPLLISATLHKVYVSSTEIEYVKEKQSLQIIVKIFIDDIEQDLQARYSPDIRLDSKKETKQDVENLKKYVLQKLKISANGNPVTLQYIGKEYDIDIVNMYFEVDNISELKSIEIENKILFDMFPKQHNIIHFKKSKDRQNLILDKDHPKGMLNFN